MLLLGSKFRWRSKKPLRLFQAKNSIWSSRSISSALDPTAGNILTSVAPSTQKKTQSVADDHIRKADGLTEKIVEITTKIRVVRTSFLVLSWTSSSWLLCGKGLWRDQRAVIKQFLSGESRVKRGENKKIKALPIIFWFSRALSWPFFFLNWNGRYATLLNPFWSRRLKLERYAFSLSTLPFLYSKKKTQRRTHHILRLQPRSKPSSRALKTTMMRFLLFPNC